MGSRISEICVNVVDPETMAAFWSAALGYPVIARDDEGVGIMGLPDRPSLLFVRTDDVSGPPKAGPNRLHLDLSPTGDDQAAEVARLEGLGATRIDIGQGTPSWVVMADPEGNEFCVLRRTVPPEPAPFDEEVVAGTARFDARDMGELSGLVADAWTAGADRDWSAPAGTLEWSCLATADHAVDCVYAPTFFLASRRTDGYPLAGGDLTLGAAATPAALVESLQIATRVLVAVVRATAPDVRSILFPMAEPVLGAPADFLPRAAMELILHAHDVCAGLGVAFEPPAPLVHRLCEHTRPWPIWTRMWAELGHGDDPWGDLLAAAGRARPT